MSAAPTLGPSGPEEREVLFERFEYFSIPASTHERGWAVAADLARDTVAVASGLGHVLAILERDMIDGGCDDGTGKPCSALLPGDVTGSLHRMSIAVLGMLARRAFEVGETARSEAVSARPGSACQDLAMQHPTPAAAGAEKTP